MVDLTVGQVSGIINFCVVIVQFTLPLAFVLILIAFLENENNAVTWSVVGRTLQASMWPSLLSADSASSHGVRKRVIFITTLSTIALIILAVAGVVTPLGLNEEITPSFAEPVAFKYLKYTSTFGQGTNSRDGYVFARLCGWTLWQNCPGTFGGYTSGANETGRYLDGPDGAYMDTNVPQNITEIFKSGTSGRGNLVSGPFDVQFRLFTNVKDTDVGNNASKNVPINQGKVHSEGMDATLRSVILDDNYVLVEGLVVDAKTGGVGFRNHSAPANLQYGGTWDESLLWVEPVSSVPNGPDNNFTIDFTVIANQEIGNVRLTDNGGWANLVRARPDFDRADSQLDVQLWQRAYKGAWMSNVIAASFHNVTKNMTGLGKSYSLMEGDSTFGLSSYKTTSVAVGDMNGDWMKGNREGIDTSKNFTTARVVKGQEVGVEASSWCSGYTSCALTAYCTTSTKRRTYKDDDRMGWVLEDAVSSVGGTIRNGRGAALLLHHASLNRARDPVNAVGPRYLRGRPTRSLLSATPWNEAVTGSYPDAGAKGMDTEVAGSDRNGSHFSSKPPSTPATHPKAPTRTASTTYNTENGSETRGNAFTSNPNWSTMDAACRTTLAASTTVRQNGTGTNTT
ncbi:hypothetical protein L873DRAFT_1849572 [Choiromyces venosus 120613-1]|uniref:Uncharacterized protein n=1 Tax=Choiromyces venosus 120613-1 TaxID=1336337 RepID=A0A3N4IX37_9PEZI|nr:hypothetical protein L873DRAFT_1849572 [Choiromyces venosus 120613-1]